MVTLIRHIEKKGTHFRGQQVGRCGPRGSGHSSQGERCCKIPPGAMGNRETRSGEFCRGMPFFISYFSRSTPLLDGSSLIMVEGAERHIQFPVVEHHASLKCSRLRYPLAFILSSLILLLSASAFPFETRCRMAFRIP